MKLSLLLIAGLIFSNAFAQVGDTGGTGGDTDEIRYSRIQKQIAIWIEQGGAHGLVLPAELSVHDYNQRMLKAIHETPIEMTDDELTVDGIAKTCKTNFNPVRTRCNIARFKSALDLELFRLVHHEAAVAAKIETKKNGKSDYSLSDQIGLFIRTNITHELVVKPQIPSHFETFRLKIIDMHFSGGFNPSLPKDVEKLSRFQKACIGYLREAVSRLSRVLPEQSGQVISTASWNFPHSALVECDLEVSAPPQSLILEVRKLKPREYYAAIDELEFLPLTLPSFVIGSIISDQLQILRGVSDERIPLPQPEVLPPVGIAEYCRKEVTIRAQRPRTVRYLEGGAFEVGVSSGGRWCKGRYLESDLYELELSHLPSQTGADDLPFPIIKKWVWVPIGEGFAVSKIRLCPASLKVQFQPSSGKLIRVEALDRCQKVSQAEDGSIIVLKNYIRELKIRGQVYEYLYEAP